MQLTLGWYEHSHLTGSVMRVDTTRLRPQAAIKERPMRLFTITMTALLALPGCLDRSIEGCDPEMFDGAESDPVESAEPSSSSEDEPEDPSRAPEPVEPADEACVVVGVEDGDCEGVDFNSCDRLVCGLATLAAGRFDHAECLADHNRCDTPECERMIELSECIGQCYDDQAVYALDNACDPDALGGWVDLDFCPSWCEGIVGED